MAQCEVSRRSSTLRNRVIAGVMAPVCVARRLRPVDRNDRVYLATTHVQSQPELHAIAQRARVWIRLWDAASDRPLTGASSLHGSIGPRHVFRARKVLNGPAHPVFCAMIRVLIADDEALIRGGLRLIVDAQPDLDVVGEATDGRDVLLQVRDLVPDLVLMDIHMPGLDGLEATRRLLAGSSPRPKVLVLTTFDRDEYLYDAIRAGASGFLLKSAGPQQLVDGIRAAVGGYAPLAPEITLRLLQRFIDRPPPSAQPPGELADLTNRELDVLRSMADGLSNAEIAALLCVSAATVKTHVNHILTKLGLRDRVQAVVLAYRSGIMDRSV